MLSMAHTLAMFEVGGNGNLLLVPQCVSLFQRRRKQELLLWGYWCYLVENRERKHAYFRHFVFFPQRHNKIKHFLLHTHFLFVWGRVGMRSLPSFPAGTGWGSTALRAVFQPQSRMPHCFQILNFCAESPVGAAVTNGFLPAAPNHPQPSQRGPRAPGHGAALGHHLPRQLPLRALPLQLLRPGAFTW